jgi:hypothetical protein
VWSDIAKIMVTAATVMMMMMVMMMTAVDVA